MRTARAIIAASFFINAFFSLDARADEAPDPTAVARKEYGAGKEAYAARRFAEAALHFEAAAAIRPHAVTLYTAALAWETAGKPERAADDYSRSLDVAGLDGKQQENARARLNALEAVMGTLIIKGPEGAHAQLEGLSETTTPARLHASPGAHVLIARFSGDKPALRKDVQMELNQVATVEVKDDAPATPVADAPKPVDTPAPTPTQPKTTASAPPAKFPVMKAVGVGVAGLGVGFVVGGAVLGVNALSAKDAYNAGPTRSSYDHANSLATWSTVAFVAGGVLTAGGIALLLIPSGGDKAEGSAKTTTAKSSFQIDHMQLSPTLSGAMLSGAF